MYKRKAKGVSLIELVFTIAIFSIVIFLAFPSLEIFLKMHNSIFKIRKRDMEFISVFKVIEKKIENSLNSKNYYMVKNGFFYINIYDFQGAEGVTSIEEFLSGGVINGNAILLTNVIKPSNDSEGFEHEALIFHFDNNNLNLTPLSYEKPFNFGRKRVFIEGVKGEFILKENIIIMKIEDVKSKKGRKYEKYYSIK